MMRIAISTETFLPKLDGIVSIRCLALRRLHERRYQTLVFGPPDMPAEYAGARGVGTGGPRFPLYPEVRMNLPTRRIGRAPFGLVALEAMACGLSAIAGMSGGLIDILEDGVNALVCDPQSIAECLSRLQRSPDLYARLRQGALEHACGRSLRATMDQLIDYYHLAMRIHRLRVRSRPQLDIC